MKESKIDVVYVVASKLGSIGMGKASYNAIKGIDDSDLSYDVFCRGHKKDLNLNPHKLHSYGFLEWASYPFRFLEKKMGFNINPFKYINKAFGELINWNLPKSKIYHTWMRIAPKAIKKAKKNGTILILEGHNSHPLNSLNIMNSEYKKLGLNEFIQDPKEIKDEIELIKQFDYVMCSSEFVYESFLNQGFRKEQLIKLSYGVDTNKFKPSKIKKENKKIRFIFVGSVQIRKGVHYLLQAWEELKLKDAELLIIGREYPDVQKILKKDKKNNSIKFIGFADLKKYYAASDVFIFPSLEEGSALVNYEAMACGLPLITTFNSGSIARNGKEGFIIPPGNIPILKNKIKYFYDHPKEIERMGKNARKRVENYAWKNYGKKLTVEYKKILKNKKI